MPKKNRESIKAELRKLEEQKQRDEWEEPEDIIEFSTEFFHFCNVGPKNVPANQKLSPLAIFMLFFGIFTYCG
jgi:hypothetical protein